MAGLEDLTLVGITGVKQSGKDTIASFLCERYGFQRVAFADPLKEMAAAIGWDGSKEDGGQCQHCNMLHGRRLLQVLGTEGVRDVLGKDTWVNTTLRYIAEQRILTGQRRWVIPDVRFPNEAAMIHAHGGQVWRVVRPGTGTNDGHASETLLTQIPVDATFYNWAPLDELYRKVQDHAERCGWHEGALLPT